MQVDVHFLAYGNRVDHLKSGEVDNESSDNHAATAIEVILDSPDWKWLINYAAAVEKENLSWDATIGPAVKALKRLGRTSAGKDFDKLAAYAKAHQKPQTVQ